MYGNDQGVDVGKDMGTSSRDENSEKAGDISYDSTIGRLLQQIKMKTKNENIQKLEDEDSDKEKQVGESEHE